MNWWRKSWKADQLEGGRVLLGTRPRLLRLAIEASIAIAVLQEIYFSFRSLTNSLRASQELTVLIGLFLPPFSAHRS